VTLKFTELYFCHTLDVGTPFTKEGASELLRVGILMTAIPVASNVLGGIAFGAFKLFYEVPSDLQLSEDITMGLVVIFLSFVFKYAAELLSEKAEKIVDEPEDDAFSGQGSANGNSDF
jgi:hypothetical protein